MLALFTTAERMILDWLVFWCGPLESALHSPQLAAPELPHPSFAAYNCKLQREREALGEACCVTGVVQGAAVL